MAMVPGSLQRCADARCASFIAAHLLSRDRPLADHPCARRALKSMIAAFAREMCDAITSE
jgi:hypothetical protein